jgi:hypothetical protein
MSNGFDASYDGVAVTISEMDACMLDVFGRGYGLPVTCLQSGPKTSSLAEGVDYDEVRGGDSAAA